MHHPFLAGTRLYLRGLEPSDLDGSYFQWFNDQNVCQHNYHGRFPNFPSRMDAYFQHVATGSPNDLVLAIVLNDRNLHIGNISLLGIDWFSRQAEFAILLGDRNYWGMGLSKEAAGLLARHAFSTLNLRRLWCGTSVANLPMQALARALGMREEGRQRQALYKNGVYHDIVLFGALREEFFDSRMGEGQ